MWIVAARTHVRAASRKGPPTAATPAGKQEKAALIGVMGFPAPQGAGEGGLRGLPSLPGGGWGRSSPHHGTTPACTPAACHDGAPTQAASASDSAPPMAMTSAKPDPRRQRIDVQAQHRAVAFLAEQCVEIAESAVRPPRQSPPFTATRCDGLNVTTFPPAAGDADIGDARRVVRPPRIVQPSNVQS